MKTVGLTTKLKQGTKLTLNRFTCMQSYNIDRLDYSEK